MAETPAARESPSPRAFREDSSYTPPPPRYKAPSLLAEHRGLAVVFAVAALAFASYCLKTKHPAHARNAPAALRPAAISPAVPPPAVPPPAGVAAAHSAPAQSAATQPIYVESVP